MRISARKLALMAAALLCIVGVIHLSVLLLSSSTTDAPAAGAAPRPPEQRSAPEALQVVVERFSKKQDDKLSDFSFRDDLGPDASSSWSFAAEAEHAIKAAHYSRDADDVLRRLRSNMATARNPKKPFAFHVYQVPERYTTGAIALMEQNWAINVFPCNKLRTNYTMLDWRHAHSLFTADVFMAKFLRLHPAHTNNPDEADIFIIPMMTHVYNCARQWNHMKEVLGFVTQLPYYKLYDQHDHYMFWWRWGMNQKAVGKFWKKVAQYIPNVNIISFDLLELQGRNRWQDFSLALKPRFREAVNSIIVPYPDFAPSLVAPVAAIHRSRKHFFYMSGTHNIGGIRRWIRHACNQHPDDCTYVSFAKRAGDPQRAAIPESYPSMMLQSVFCGHAAGDALSSRRPTSAVLAGCIPVLICDLCLYAWENFVDYSSFAVFVAEDDVIHGKLFSILRQIPQDRIETLQSNLKLVRRHFVYNTTHAPSEGDALDMLVRELSVRGSMLRSYRRWWNLNAGLSSNARDYPAEPLPRKKYVNAAVDGCKEIEADFPTS